MPITIIVHGGAKEIEPEEEGPNREGCRRAAEAGWKVLAQGGTSIAAVEAAIRVLEDDPTFNAGYGSELNVEGEVQMDASIMSGKDLKSGAVAYIQGVRHPISVARRVHEEEVVLLAGDGARCFAVEHEAELCPNSALVTEERRKEWEEKRLEGATSKANNTVGCVALDRDGNIVAGASTGGTGMNPRGRVGDTPLVGCGIYADNEVGGASLTGNGEDIARVVLAKMALVLVDRGEPPEDAAREAIVMLERRTGGEAGCILVDKAGRIGWSHNSREMAVAYRTEDGEAQAYIRKGEESDGR